MAADNQSKERKKVAVNEETYDLLKNFSRFNGLKLRVVLDALAEMISENEVLAEQVVRLALKKQSEDSD